MARTIKSRVPSQVQQVCKVRDGRPRPCSGQSSAFVTMAVKVTRYKCTLPCGSPYSIRSPARRSRIGVKVPGLWAMMYVLFDPAQFQRQAPQRGTRALPRQSEYHPTGRLTPRRGMAIQLAPIVIGGQSAAAMEAATSWPRTSAGRTWRNVRGGAHEATGAAQAVAAAVCRVLAGWPVSSGRLRSQMPTPIANGVPHRRTRCATAAATPRSGDDCSRYAIVTSGGAKGPRPPPLPSPGGGGFGLNTGAPWYTCSDLLREATRLGSPPRHGNGAL